MADLNARIKPKKSSAAGEVPQAADLEVAEIAVNTADGKLFTKHTDNSIVTISGGGGGAVDSVNGETGVVSLGIQDMEDVEIPAVFRYVKGTDSSPDNPGQFYYITTNLKINKDDADGNDAGLGSATELWMSIDSGATWEHYSLGSPVLEFGVRYTWSGLSGTGDEFPSVYGAVSGTNVLVATQEPLADGGIIQWDDVNQAFKPAQLPTAAGTRTLLGIGEYADDAAAGTGGVASGALYYNTTSSDYRLKT